VLLMTQSQSIGVWRGVSLEVAAWDAAHAEVDLSAVCMFTHEIAEAGLKGGLLHLDQALSGGLAELCRSGEFKADFMETLLISKPPSTIRAAALLVIGLGNPSSWTAATTAHAVKAVARAAVYRGDRSVAFAPSLLDSRLTSSQTGDVALDMMRAVIEIIEVQTRVVERGLAHTPRLQHWIFDVGLSRADAVTEHFREGFQSITSALRAGSTITTPNTDDPSSAPGENNG